MAKSSPGIYNKSKDLTSLGCSSVGKKGNGCVSGCEWVLVSKVAGKKKGSDNFQKLEKHEDAMLQQTLKKNAALQLYNVSKDR